MLSGHSRYVSAWATKDYPYRQSFHVITALVDQVDDISELFRGRSSVCAVFIRFIVSLRFRFRFSSKTVSAECSSGFKIHNKARTSQNVKNT
jgi:hypothetical protein